MVFGLCLYQDRCKLDLLPASQCYFFAKYDDCFTESFFFADD